MNTDMEDFINTKNALGADDYNNFDVSMWDISGCKKIFENEHVLSFHDINPQKKIHH